MDPLSMNLAFDGPFHWLLALFGLFAVGTFAWLLARDWPRRFAVTGVDCPRDGRPAFLVFRRKADGARGALVSCSRGGRARRMSCRRECLVGDRRAAPA